MNRSVKGAFLLFTTFLLVFSLISCATIYNFMDQLEYRIDPGPYTPFTPVVFEAEGIDQPEHAWTYHWPESYNRTLESLTAPSIDQEGNIYFVGYNRYLYALDSSGERKWGKKSFFDPLVVSEEGLIVRSSRGIMLLDFDGNELWKRNMTVGEYFLAPDGFLVGKAWDRLVSFDSNGKLRWYLPFKDDQYDYYSLKGCFFDTQANGYYIFNASVPETAEMKKNMQFTYHTIMMSVSSEGLLRWKKVLSTERQFLEDFVPTKESLVKDTFLLAFHQAEREEPPEVMTQKWYDESRVRWWDAKKTNPKTIKAFNTDGEELWEMEEKRLGLHDLDYAIDQENNFYFSFNEREADDEVLPLVSAHLMSWSKEGDLLWSNAIPYLIETPPLLDNHRHVYVGVEEGETNLMAFYPDGTEKWRTKVDVLYRYKHSLSFGPDRSIYFTSKIQSLMFCVREKN